MSKAIHNKTAFYLFFNSLAPKWTYTQLVGYVGVDCSHTDEPSVVVWVSDIVEINSSSSLCLVSVAFFISPMFLKTAPLVPTYYVFKSTSWQRQRTIGPTSKIIFASSSSAWQPFTRLFISILRNSCFNLLLSCCASMYMCILWRVLQRKLSKQIRIG